MAELGKYQLGARLGGGGMAEVFAASTVGADGVVRRVAIKRVLPELGNDLQFVELFMAEAQIGARLVHPNIVSVIDFDHDAAGDLFIAMELVEGCDLATLAAGGLMPFPVVIHVIAEVMRGLAYAHHLPGGGPVRGVVHRDMSPQNVLLRASTSRASRPT